MPDIAKCTDSSCPSRGTCYRYRVRPSEWQSYGGFHVLPDQDKCEMYWPVTPMKWSNLLPRDDADHHVDG
jgi:hypothetical protein